MPSHDEFDSAPQRVMHVVSGGFSGATQVAVHLADSAQRTGQGANTWLALRHKRQADRARIQALRDRGLQVIVLPNGPHALTVWSLTRWCRRLGITTLLAHGNPEHLIGREAGLRAGVPQLIHVEHSSRERYPWWRLRRLNALLPHTQAFIGVSEGVRQRLLGLGCPPERTHAIPNGIHLQPFTGAQGRDFAQRERALLMSARFARPKDHASLIRALALLRDQGLRMPLRLAGGGSAKHLRAAQALVAQLQLGDQVEFLGHVHALPDLLMRTAYFVLSTHWEGMPLALVEAMAAGCACVATRAPGVEGVLEDGVTGLTVPPQDPAALAAALRQLWLHPQEAAQMAQAARAQAWAHHDLATMAERYQALIKG